MKICTKCRKEKPLSEFYPLNKNYKNGTPRYRYRCSECTRFDSLKHHHAQPPERKYGDFRKDRNLRYVYGISLEEFKEMLKNQNGVCYLCDKSIEGKKVHLDHNHHTGKIRKLLCSNCNTGLGLLNESPEFLRKCAVYLEEHA